MKVKVIWTSELGVQNILPLAHWYLPVGWRIERFWRLGGTKIRVAQWVPNTPLDSQSYMWSLGGDNGTEKLLITLDHVSCTNYFMSIEISWCGVRLIKIAKPDKKIMWQKHTVSSQYDATITRCRVTTSDRGRFILIQRMQTNGAYEFMGVNPPSFPSIPPTDLYNITG